MNNFSFTGNIGNVKELRYTPNGDAVLNFSVAVTSGYGPNKTTTWANCSLWGKRAESLSPYIVKGAQIGGNGEITLRTYESNGKSGTSLDVRLQDVTLLGKREHGDNAEPSATSDFGDDDFTDF
jgi:single-strand DNA-binding protein